MRKNREKRTMVVIYFPPYATRNQLVCIRRAMRELKVTHRLFKKVFDYKTPENDA